MTGKSFDEMWESEGREIPADHGLKPGDVVVEVDSDRAIEGTIQSLDLEDETAWVTWDNGHESFDVPLADLIPVGGW